MRVLGHDVYGRPLRVGDLCVATGKPDHPFCGRQCIVTDHKAPVGTGGELVIDVEGRLYAFDGKDLRKLNGKHKPADESFAEIIQNLKAENA